MGRLDVSLTWLAEMLDRVPDRVSRAVSASIIVLWILFGLAFVLANLDRSVPTRLVSATQSEEKDRYLTVLMDIEVDRSRRCSRTMVRSLVDAKGAVYYLGEDVVSRDARSMMMSSPPGPQQLVVSARVPDAAAIGSAMLVLQSAYICNALQQWWPIRGTMRIPVIVSQ